MFFVTSFAVATLFYSSFAINGTNLQFILEDENKVIDLSSEADLGSDVNSIAIDMASLPGEHLAESMEVLGITVINPGEGKFIAPGPYDIIQCEMKGWSLDGNSIFDTSKLSKDEGELVPVDLNAVPGLRAAITRIGPGGKFKVYYYNSGQDGAKPFVYEARVDRIENWSDLREDIPGLSLTVKTKKHTIAPGIDKWFFYSPEVRDGLDDPVVKLDMQWYLVDGTKVFDNTDVPEGKVSQPVSISRFQQIAPLGLAKSLKDVAVGDHFKISCAVSVSKIRNSAALGIPPNARLIMDIKVVGTSDPSREPNRNELPGVSVGALNRVVSDTGLIWYNLLEGTGESPHINNGLSTSVPVRVHYTGYLNDGTKFDSSVDRQEPYTRPLNKFIKGFAEGVASMKVGGKRKLIIPSSLGYGSRGGGPRIPPDSLLIFDVELLEILNSELDNIKE